MPADPGTLLSKLWLLLPKLTVFLSVLVPFLFLAAGASAVVKHLKRKMPASRIPVITLLDQAAKFALIIFGLVTALGTVGVNVNALVAGLGLTGFALGFALKDALSNVLAGVLILLYRPFRIGDRVTVTGLEGIVTLIDLRYTTLAGAGRTYLIPNASLFTNPITIIHDAPA